MNKTFRTIIGSSLTGFLAISLTSSLLLAENTGASFLKIGVGAEAIGLGSAYTALANNVNALHWNPAGLSQIRTRQLGAMHNQWILDTYLDYVGFAMPLSPNPDSRFPVHGVIAASVLYFNQGELEGRGEDRSVTGNFTASDIAFTMGYSRNVPGIGALGAGVKLLRQQIDDAQAFGVAVDLGFQRALLVKDLQAGIAIQNLGPQMKFVNDGYNLPLTASVGLGYSLWGVAAVSVDVKQEVFENRTIVAAGLQFSPFNVLSLRAGYWAAVIASNLQSQALTPALEHSNLPSGVGAGLGIHLFGHSIDYSFVPYGDLGNTHRVSFMVGF